MSKQCLATDTWSHVIPEMKISACCHDNILFNSVVGKIPGLCVVMSALLTVHVIVYRTKCRNNNERSLYKPLKCQGNLKNVDKKQHSM